VIQFSSPRLQNLKSSSMFAKQFTEKKPTHSSTSLSFRSFSDLLLLFYNLDCIFVCILVHTLTLYGVAFKGSPVNLTLRPERVWCAVWLVKMERCPGICVLIITRFLPPISLSFFKSSDMIVWTYATRCMATTCRVLSFGG
jgi:hypothetical protein